MTPLSTLRSQQFQARRERWPPLLPTPNPNPLPPSDFPPPLQMKCFCLVDKQQMTIMEISKLRVDKESS